MSQPDALFEFRPLWWCATCGVVWVADGAPICRHFAIDGPPAREMEPLPSWHPYSAVQR